MPPRIGLLRRFLRLVLLAVFLKSLRLFERFIFERYAIMVCAPFVATCELARVAVWCPQEFFLGGLFSALMLLLVGPF